MNNQLVRKIKFLNKQKSRLLDNLPFIESEYDVRKVGLKINKLERQINKLNNKNQEK